MRLPVAADYSQVFPTLPALCIVVMRVTSAGTVSKTNQIHGHQCIQSGAWRPLCSCLSLLSLSPRTALSFPPSLPRCRLNPWLFIACSSRAELWVSMLRGRRGCCCRVAHPNLHGFMSWRGRQLTMFIVRQEGEESSFWGIYKKRWIQLVAQMLK